jgi:hypothetical protein
MTSLVDVVVDFDHDGDVDEAVSRRFAVDDHDHVSEVLCAA